MQEGGKDWIFDAIFAFFMSPRWQTPVQSFIEGNCQYFADPARQLTQKEKDDYLEEQHEIHTDFTKLIDNLLQALLKDLGIDQKEFVKVCQGARKNKSHWRIVKQILLVDNFKEFEKIMVKRNNELERKALSLMLENEKRQLAQYMKEQNIPETAIQDSDEYESEDDDSEDETLELTMEVSKKQALLDSGKLTEEQHMNLAMEIFNIQDQISQKKANKAKFKGGTTKTGEDMQSMMMDTAGFQKVLEMSKKEEEERQRRSTATKNREQHLMNQGIKNSQIPVQGGQSDKYEQDLVAQAIQLSQAESKLNSQKIQEEETLMKIALEKSSSEAKAQIEHDEKNEQLLKIMKEIEMQKPEGWGFKRKISAAKPGDKEQMFNDYAHNLSKALLRLNIQQEVEKQKNGKDGKPQMTNDEILASLDQETNLDERKKKMQEHKEQLINKLQENRRDEMIKSNEQKDLDDQIQGQINKRRNKNKDEEPQPKKEEEPKIINDDFLNDIKLVDLPDSDDECYF